MRIAVPAGETQSTERRRTRARRSSSRTYPGGRTALPPRGSRAGRCARSRARTPTRSAPRGRVRASSRGLTRAQRGRRTARSSGLEELDEIGDDDIGAMLAQRLRLADAIDPDDEAEGTGARG